MTIEAQVMFRQDEPLSYEMFDYYHVSNATASWQTTAAAMAPSISSPENRFSGETGELEGKPPLRKRRRRKMRSEKNVEEIEHQRITHIAVERNRRKQMNHLLSVLRSIMPPSYSQKGDQASIVGGAIKYVKELEQILQSLEAQKAIQSKQAQSQSIFSNFFILPQYSTAAATFSGGRIRAAVADVEVTMAERHANIKVLTKAQPRLLSKMITEFYSLGLTVLCLNLTTSQHMVLFTFSVKVEETVQVTCVDDIASAVHELVRRIQREN